MLNIRFREEILPLKDKLFRLAFRITLDSGEAEDIVQEAMVRVWNKRDEWSEWKSVEAFCITVTRNLALDRSEKKDNQHLTLTDETLEWAELGTPELQYEVSEQYRLVEQLISGLPEKQRTIIQLRDVEGRSYKEIAELMELSEEQVKVNLHRARQKIKQQFNEINNYGL